MPYFIYRLFLPTLAMLTERLHGLSFLAKTIRKTLGFYCFNFSDRFREVFEFYFTGFLNGIELYNILKTLDFKIIPKSWGNFVF